MLSVFAAKDILARFFSTISTFPVSQLTETGRVWLINFQHFLKMPIFLFACLLLIKEVQTIDFNWLAVTSIYVSREQISFAFWSKWWRKLYSFSPGHDFLWLERLFGLSLWDNFESWWDNFQTLFEEFFCKLFSLSFANISCNSAKCFCFSHNCILSEKTISNKK